MSTNESSIRSFWIWGDAQRHVSLVTLVVNTYGTVRYGTAMHAKFVILHLPC
jgi:hypothetical protein